jgi:Male sterility protein
VDRQDDASLVAAVGDGCDVVVDCVAFDEVHARQIVGLAGLVGSAVVLSSVGVYADARGRTLDEATNEEDFPVFGDDPDTERQTTVAPGPSTYSTRKFAMEQVLLEAELPVTVLRPGTITGPHSAHPRELWFVQRALDHRPVQILAHQGRSQFHTCSTPNLAELVRLAARSPGSRVLNAVDPTRRPPPRSVPQSMPLWATPPGNSARRSTRPGGRTKPMGPPPPLRHEHERGGPHTRISGRDGLPGRAGSNRVVARRRRPRPETGRRSSRPSCASTGLAHSITPPKTPG